MKQQVPPTVTVQPDYHGCANAVMLRSGVSLCRSLDVTNNGSTRISNLQITVGGYKIKESSLSIATIPAGATLRLEGSIIALSDDALDGLTHPIDTFIEVAVHSGESDFGHSSFPLRLLPNDWWTGTATVPELLASHVAPWFGGIERIIDGASLLLDVRSGDSCIDGYQSRDEVRVKDIIDAVFCSIADEQFTARVLSAQEISGGVRVQQQSELMNSKQGTLLDIALLAAACLETCSLNAIIAITDSHVLVGAWLIDDHGALPTGDDATYLLKRMATGVDEVVLFDVGRMCTVPLSHSFGTACNMASQALRDPEDTLQVYVDVAACRMRGIESIVQSSAPQHAFKPSVLMPQPTVSESETGSGRQLTRRQIWERRLLDFSMRNNLLNMKIGRRVVQFVCYGIEQLEDCLSDRRDFEIVPNAYASLARIDGDVVDSSLHSEFLRPIAEDALAHYRLMAYPDESRLDDALKNIYRCSRTTMEESGSNTLFLALGVLKWYEGERSHKPRFAPILLKPMQLVRRKANCYVLRPRDEETIINITLLEMLRQQFKLELPNLDPLPLDEHGGDVVGVLSALRRGIKDMPRWDVYDECALGVFSFNKFVMWNDLRRAGEKFAKHPFIAALLGREPMRQAPQPRVDNPDHDYPPQSLALPVDVDSSQLAAVIEAHNGRSFVLHGPPGTGKSQTITNIIANALFNGKRVLFVAAKMAALEVVQKRLAQIGLATFCLELHSNKVSKAHFLNQLREALTVTRRHEPEDYNATAEALAQKRNQLNNVVRDLHRRRKSGLTLNDCIERYLSATASMSLTIDGSVVSKVTEASLKTIVDELRGATAILEVLGSPGHHPLYGLKLRPEALTQLPQVNSLLGKVLSAARDVLSALDTTNKLTGLRLSRDRSAAVSLPSLLDELEKVGVLTTGRLKAIEDDDILPYLSSVIDKGRENDQVLLKLGEMSFDQATLDLDPDELERRWIDIKAMWWPKRYFARRRFEAELGTRFLGPKLSLDDHLPPLIELLRKHNRNKEEIEAARDTLIATFGTLATPGAEQWDEMSSDSSNLKHFKEYLAGSDRRLGIDTYAALAALRSAVERDSGNIDLSDLNWQFDDARQACRDYVEALDQLGKLINFDASDSIPSLIDRLGPYHHVVLISGAVWYNWCEFEQRMRGYGLDSAVYAIATGAAPDDVADAVVKEVYKLLIDYYVSQSPALLRFAGRIFENTIDNFRKLDASFAQLTRELLYSRLAANVPVVGRTVSAHSEVGIALRNIANNGRGNSIRSIIEQIPTLLPRLCPCMLMSPLSVAQFLGMDTEPFDLVIFDEASQLPTCEAVGAIARGKAIVVVGDPQQMPPSNFFTVSQVGDDEADIDDLDSVLDDAIAMSLPSRHLTWHYRSKHESLIAFSNARYYGGQLYTFPSVDDRLSRVNFVRIIGTYDKGRRRNNEAEAEAIVAELVQRISRSDESVGVVAFSQAQQNLIEDKFVEALDANPELESRAYGVPEPVFIKNLENVQGDERDVILFSVGYGPDSKGRVSMNFGPLNNKGGERRLNVAVSRARNEMMVFSTLMPDQIDLTRSHAAGVEGLKLFLEYARSGRLPLPPEQVRTPHSVIVDDIARQLTERGMQVSTHVGRSQFKVDIAVASPGKPDQYLFGIVCDGENYSQSITARDREVCRPAMLQALGWVVLRVWTLDWLNNTAAELERIEEVYRRLKFAPEATPGLVSSITQRRGRRSNADASETRPAAAVDAPANDGEPAQADSATTAPAPTEETATDAEIQKLSTSQAPAVPETPLDSVSVPATEPEPQSELAPAPPAEPETLTAPTPIAVPEAPTATTPAPPAEHGATTEPTPVPPAESDAATEPIPAKPAVADQNDESAQHYTAAPESAKRKTTRTRNTAKATGRTGRKKKADTQPKSDTQPKPESQPKPRLEAPLYPDVELVVGSSVGEEIAYPTVQYSTPDRAGLLNFLDGININAEVRQIMTIVYNEQPVTEAMICTRMCEIWDIDGYKNINFVVKRVHSLLNRCPLYKDPMSQANNPTFWIGPGYASLFGRNVRSGAGRKNTEIPTIEVANFIIIALRQEVAMPLDDLQRRATLAFDFKRRTPKFNLLVEFAVSNLLRNRAIRKEGKMYMLP